MTARGLPDSARDSADREVIIPEGHERGETMTWSQRAMCRALWPFVQVM